MPLQPSYFGKKGLSREAQGRLNCPVGSAAYEYDPSENFVVLDEESHDAEWVRVAPFSFSFLENER